MKKGLATASPFVFVSSRDCEPLRLFARWHRYGQVPPYAAVMPRQSPFARLSFFVSPVVP